MDGCIQTLAYGKTKGISDIEAFEQFIHQRLKAKSNQPSRSIYEAICSKKGAYALVTLGIFATTGVCAYLRYANQEYPEASGFEI